MQKNNKNKKYFFFDWDNTLASKKLFPNAKSNIPEEILNSFDKIHSKGYITTIMTSRDPVELLSVLDNIWNKIITPQMLIGLEYGSRIGRLLELHGKAVFKDVETKNLDDKEIDQILMSVRQKNNLLVKNDIFIKYYDKIKDKQVIWTSKKYSLNYLKEQFPDAKEFINIKLSDLATLLKKITVTSITVHGNVDFPNDLNNINSPELNCIIPKGVSKKYGVERIANILNINLNDCITSGDSETDEPMLKIQDIEESISVGNDDLANEKPKSKNVKNPKHLGEYLLNFIKNN